MSFQAMAWAVKQKVGNATGKAILIMLANYADEKGECFPSQERLADECECSVSTVARWIQAFEGIGFLSRQKQYGEGGYRRADRLCINTDLPVTELPSRELPNSVQKLTRHSDVAEPIKEPTSLRSGIVSGRDVDAFRAELSQLLDADLIETLIQSRRNKRAAINGNAGGLLVKALGRCPDARAAAEEMAVRGWTSVKPEWLVNSVPVRGSPPSTPKPPSQAEIFGMIGARYAAEDQRGASENRGDARAVISGPANSRAG